MNNLNSVSCSVCLKGFSQNPSRDSEPLSVHTRLSSLEVMQLLRDSNSIDGEEGHIFHRLCINTWIESVCRSGNEPNCPVCRRCVIGFSELCDRVNAAAVRQPDEITQRNEALAAVRQGGLALQYASYPLRSDRDVVLSAVRQNGPALLYASSSLQDDKEVVLSAVRQNGPALLYASSSLQDDKEVALVAVRQLGLALQYASDQLRGDREVVLSAVSQNGLALQYVSDQLLGDGEVVLSAVSQNGLALQYASYPLRGGQRGGISCC